MGKVWDKIVVPTYKGARGVAAGTVTAGLAGTIVTVPFVAAAALNYGATPFVKQLKDEGTWRIAFGATGAIVTIGGLALAVTNPHVLLGAKAVLGLVSAGSFVIGAVGGFLTAVKAGYSNGLLNGIATGFNEALGLAAKTVQTAVKNLQDAWDAKK